MITSQTHLRQQLIQLHNRNILAQANPRAHAEGKLRSLKLETLLLALQPPLRAERLRILPIKPLIALHRIRMARDLRTLGHIHAIDHLSALGRDSCEEIGGRRIQTQTFFDTGYEVREVLARFFVLDWVGEAAGLGCGVDFGLSACEGGLIGYEEAQDGAEGCAGGVGAGLDEESDVGTLLDGS